MLSMQPLLAAPNTKRTSAPIHSCNKSSGERSAHSGREEQGKALKVQRPVYYISKVLTPYKQRYPHYQKLVYSIYLTVKKVAHYFQEHMITIVSDAPLSEILNNRD